MRLVCKLAVGLHPPTCSYAPPKYTCPPDPARARGPGSLLLPGGGHLRPDRAHPQPGPGAGAQEPGGAGGSTCISHASRCMRISYAGYWPGCILSLDPGQGLAVQVAGARSMCFSCVVIVLTVGLAYGMHPAANLARRKVFSAVYSRHRTAHGVRHSFIPPNRYPNHTAVILCRRSTPSPSLCSCCTTRARALSGPRRGAFSCTWGCRTASSSDQRWVHVFKRAAGLCISGGSSGGMALHVGLQNGIRIRSEVGARVQAGSWSVY